MAERNEKVLERVRTELQRNPNTPSRDLFEMVKAEQPEAVRDESLRSFHGRYVLSLKRGAGKTGRSGGAAKKGARKAAGKTARKGARKGTRGAAAAETGSRPRAAYGSRGGKRQREAEARRTQVRGIFLQFAREIAGAESRADIVNVIGNVDRYVDEVVG